MAHLESGGEIHRRGLLLDRFDDGFAAVAGIHAPKTGGAVQNLAIVGRIVVHPFRAREQARLALELPVGRERHPKRFEVVGIDRHRSGWHRAYSPEIANGLPQP
jgi:hypothetical protein